MRQLIAGSESEYSAHLIPEGGYNAIPTVHGGWVIYGDSGGFVNRCTATER